MKYQVTIPHNVDENESIKFETDDRAIARKAVEVGKVIGVDVTVVENVEPKVVKFMNL